jgi:hypothetical protein
VYEAPPLKQDEDVAGISAGHPKLKPLGGAVVPTVPDQFKLYPLHVPADDKPIEPPQTFIEILPVLLELQSIFVLVYEAVTCVGAFICPPPAAHGSPVYDEF